VNEKEWMEEFPGTITVCDPNGILLEMNERAARGYEKDGGRALLGKNMLDCHPDPARSKTERLLAARERNVYTIEKNGLKKLIYQSPWYKNGQYAGFVELALEIPADIPHFVRS
jgi:transcriptional regulator with PAS, ATPase and Fis domain